MRQLSVYNPGRPIHDWQAKRSQIVRVTLLDNQSIDLDEDIAMAFIKEFPYLKIMSSITTVAEKVGSQVSEGEEVAWLERKAEEQMKEQVNELAKNLPPGVTPDAPHFCSVCSSNGIRWEGKNKLALNAHLRFKHKA